MQRLEPVVANEVVEAEIVPAQIPVRDLNAYSVPSTTDFLKHGEVDVASGVPLTLTDMVMHAVWDRMGVRVRADDVTIVVK